MLKGHAAARRDLRVRFTRARAHTRARTHTNARTRAHTLCACRGGAGALLPAAAASLQHLQEPQGARARVCV